MSETVVETKVDGKWPAGKENGDLKGPVTEAALENAAARACASRSRRDLVEYLRMRRKTA